MPDPQAARTVTIYVSTDRVFSEPVLRAYERQSGVTVNAVYDTEETKSTGLANRLLAEQARPQADVFWSNEPVRTLVLKSRNVLAPYRSPNADGIPPALVDPEGYWTGFSARIRVIAYNTTLVKPDEAPRLGLRPGRSALARPGGDRRSPVRFDLLPRRRALRRGRRRADGRLLPPV